MTLGVLSVLVPEEPRLSFLLSLRGGIVDMLACSTLPLTTTESLGNMASGDSPALESRAAINVCRRRDGCTGKLAIKKSLYVWTNTRVNV